MSELLHRHVKVVYPASVTNGLPMPGAAASGKESAVVGFIFEKLNGSDKENVNDRRSATSLAIKLKKPAQGFSLKGILEPA